MNEANKKVATKKRCMNVQSVGHLIAGFGPGLTSGPVVDLEGEGGDTIQRAGHSYQGCTFPL